MSNHSSHYYQKWFSSLFNRDNISFCILFHFSPCVRITFRPRYIYTDTSIEEFCYKKQENPHNSFFPGWWQNEKSTQRYGHAHLDEFGNDLCAVLGALRRSSTADILLLQEEGDQPGDEGHTGCQVLVPGAESALTVPHHWHIHGSWSVMGEVWSRETVRGEEDGDSRRVKNGKRKKKTAREIKHQLHMYSCEALKFFSSWIKMCSLYHKATGTAQILLFSIYTCSLATPFVF